VVVVGVGDDGQAGLPPGLLARVAQAQLLVGGIATSICSPIY